MGTRFPEIAKEWHPTLNGDKKPSDFFPGSHDVVWWLCPKGHEYDLKIETRTKKHQDCPICSGKRIVPGKNDLVTLYPEVAKKWDYEQNGDLDPRTLSPGSNTYVWWKCDKGHPFKSMVISMIRSRKGMNCPYCRNFKLLKGFNDLASKRPDLAKQWDMEKKRKGPFRSHFWSKPNGLLEM